MPNQLITWFRGSAQSTLVQFNPSLNRASVESQCANVTECIHDYVIRLNDVASRSTGTSLTEFSRNRDIIGKFCYDSIHRPCKIAFCI